MDVVEHAFSTICEQDLCSPEAPVILMVSGGGDSTALTYIAKELHDQGQLGTLEILHVNHCLRGEDSDADEQFVQGLAQLLDVPMRSVRIDIQEMGAQTGENIESLARHMRYQAAQEALAVLCQVEMTPISDGRIFVAHNADDRIENFYMRSIVGTGPGGFRSMRYKNRRVARPLLDMSRESLRDYIQERAAAGLPVMRDEQGALWREDATNAHSDRFRTFVRHEIVPLAERYNPSLRTTLTRTMNQIADEDDMLCQMTNELITRNVEWAEADMEACVLSPRIANEPLPLKRRVVVEVLRRMLGDDSRVEARSVRAVLDAFNENGVTSGYVANIQGNLAVSANKAGVRIEPMAAFRIRRGCQR